jgi:class 3 adenylate cyclase
MTEVTTSVVFTDLVGSTEMASRLGPAAADAIRQVHFGLLRGAVEATGGTEVKNLGDGLMVVYPSLGAALDSAVAMQQAIARYNDKGNEPLGVRVGLSNGDATSEDGDYFGPPVIEAARLCANATGGQILTTQLVSLIARNSGHDFAAIGDLELKGLPEPVSVVEIGWERTADPSAQPVPFPPRLAASVEAVIVGRDQERAGLEEALKAATSGSQRVVLVSGEPGIGKTRLTSEACQTAFNAGAVVLYGRCDEDLAVPYQPFVEAMDHLVEHVSEEVLAAHVASYGGEIARLVPRIAQRLVDVPPAKASDPETEKYLLFQAVAGLLASTAVDAPVVLLLDDLHWADRPTLMLLRHLVSQHADQALLILGTYRDSDTSKGSALSETLAALRRERGAKRMALSGLDDVGVLEMLESIAGHAIDTAGASLAHSIGHETAGNPFFVWEILRYLNESGTIYQGADGRWAVRENADEILLPESVREVVSHRVGRLGDDVVQVLSAASVIGRDFDLSLLALVVEKSEDDVFDHLERACNAALVREVKGVEDRFTFNHALVQHSLDADLTDRHRRRLHQRVAEVLESTCGPDPGDRVGELASHWLAATTPVAPAKALHYACLAGDRALAHLAPDEAVRWFSVAVDLVGEMSSSDSQDRCALLAKLGSSQRQAGDSAYRETLLECATLAKELGDTATLVSAALANSRGIPSIIGIADAERIEVLQWALEAIGEGDNPERAMLLSLLALELTFTTSYPERAALADEAVAIARRLGDASTLAKVLTLPYIGLLVPEAHSKLMSETIEARELAAKLDDPYLRFWAAIWSGISSLGVGDISRYDMLLDEAADVAREVRQPILEWVVTLNRGVRACIAGNLDEAEQLANTAFEMATDTGQPDGITVYGTQLSVVRRLQGRSEELLPIVARIIEEIPTMPGYTATYAAHLCDADHDAEALELLLKACAGGFVLPYDAAWSTAMGYWASAAAHLQHEESAAKLYPLILPFGEFVSLTSITVSPPLALYLGELAAVLGRLEDAERHFKEAERIGVQMSAPYFLGRTYLEWATALVRAARLEDARVLARKALQQSDGRFAMIDRRSAAILDS